MENSIFKESVDGRVESDINHLKSRKVRRMCFIETKHDAT